MGFSEVVNPLFIDEEHIYKQFGPESPAILDRCFYLAGLPRPDIGLGMEKIEKIENLGVTLHEEKVQNLKEVFRDYKKGKISGDDLVHDVSGALDVGDDMGLRVLEKVFPEIRELKPLPGKTTLRSHMTSGWFMTLKNVGEKKFLPVKLFSIDRCFRREQREDSSHLMNYHSASSVIMDDEVPLDMGKAISEGLLEHFGFSNFKFLPDEKKSKYYIPETQTEVYGYHPLLDDWVEIATFGLYSPIALDNYGISKEVLNLGLGVERMAMILHDQKDIRELVYPHIYGKWAISDRELASMVKINYYPVTPEGRVLMDSILRTCREHGDEASPCEFTVFKGYFLGKNINVKVVEPEEGTKLLGPASWNNVYVYDGNIVGAPEEGKITDEIAKKAFEKGISLNISYMDGVASHAAYKIEEMVLSNNEEVKLRTTISRSISDINLTLDDVALNYITSKNKVIDVRGPIFCTITCSIED